MVAGVSRRRRMMRLVSSLLPGNPALYNSCSDSEDEFCPLPRRPWLLLDAPAANQLNPAAVGVCSATPTMVTASWDGTPHSGGLRRRMRPTSPTEPPGQLRTLWGDGWLSMKPAVTRRYHLPPLRRYTSSHLQQLLDHRQLWWTAAGSDRD